MTENAPAIVIVAPPRRGVLAYYKWINRLMIVSWCVTAFCLCVKLYTLHNDFSITFHPDENTKVDQIQEDFRNYNHPLLMLEATTWLMKWQHLPNKVVPILQAGREVSAIMAATAVIGFGLAGYFAAGWPGLILASIALGLCPSLQVYAHYMKEDASLAGGIGVTVAGMAWVWNRKSIVGQLIGPMLAGAGAALAASGKYVGAMAVVGALLAVLFAPWRRWYWIPLRVLLMAVLAVGVAAAINYRAIENWDHFRHGFDREYEHGTTEHSGVTLPPGNRFPLAVVRAETQPHIQIFTIALLLAIVTLRKKWGWDLIAVLFTASCIATLSMGAIPFHRYGLPIVVLAHFLAALGAARWLEQLSKWPKIMLPTAVAVIALFAALQGVRSADVNHQFADDSRDRLVAWARQHLNRPVKVVEDSYSLLERADLPLRLMGEGMAFAPEYGSLDDLRWRGVNTIVVCSSNYDRYFEASAKGAEGHEQEFNYRRDWYLQLFREGKVLWQAKAEHPTHSFTNPDIVVYSIRK